MSGETSELMFKKLPEHEIGSPLEGGGVFINENGIYDYFNRRLSDLEQKIELLSSLMSQKK
ncbi:hypothetical protein KKI93_16955 [Xenorhabdus bovienii]|uniref:hypothetical protein n=1 Tax=Xenorhabdus bovienii TaxID=40576 RepID=UPI00237C68F0|nr:hypothetical protein [Xenorhabdus bovienii]MDE1492821.1 hypothetical protein [Xenorhabdus bovienii]MDE9443021.1 hypothetical protein [Xenorhabdus bovienii]MDE9495613.1 hypothetical protein [Xenorhabdus bovienii]MDE9504030.1 hypothetical protein [Xenorhabdus bovienii]MDE9528198.1 hypothetical protein [Xenorhabdus bovienii]